MTVQDASGRLVYANDVAAELLGCASASELVATPPDQLIARFESAQMAVPAFADWCSVSLPREDGVLDPVAVAHVDLERVRFAHEVRERYPQRIDAPELEGFLQARRAERIEISDEMLREAARDEEHYRLLAGLGLRSAIRVPMFAGDELLGVVSFVTGEAGRTLTEADVGVAEELARRASVAIQNAELFEERSRAAVTLENALRPPRLPAIPGWRAASFYEPASGGGQVGGDFYDSFRVGDEWALMIGDVGGRGVEAAALTAMARYTLRTALAIDE